VDTERKKTTNYNETRARRTQKDVMHTARSQIVGQSTQSQHGRRLATVSEAIPAHHARSCGVARTDIKKKKTKKQERNDRRWRLGQ